MDIDRLGLIICGVLLLALIILPAPTIFGEKDKGFLLCDELIKNSSKWGDKASTTDFCIQSYVKLAIDK